MNNDDPKLENLLRLSLEDCSACRDGKGYLQGRHALHCPNRSAENLNRFFKRAVEREKHLREQAAHWLKEVRAMHGKLALLKQELSKFKKKSKYTIT
jgi:hypothetical protein